ncbi:MAG TPA: hypothetical protein VNI01_10940 [Elusimicrobiota bacterium]|nr:hypothetical protein [Elusimicrobiota bacterium]
MKWLLTSSDIMLSFGYDKLGQGGTMSPIRARISFRAVSPFILLLLSSCSSFHQIKDISNLNSDEKVIVGEVELVGTKVSDWVRGIYAGSNLVFDYKLKFRNGKLFLRAHSGQDLNEGMSGFGSKGGVFHVGVKNRPVYLVGIRSTSTIVLANSIYLFPILVSIKPSDNRCEYVGTVVIEKASKGMSVEVRDDFEKSKEKYSGLVNGCNLTKNLAAKLTPEEIDGLAKAAN